ncbi:MAG TPA: DUF4390 domain-containing protein [Gammaproteobacteria bacterium]|nr:DUF4390 domain-containing protein [Gammaproteobacteria bacterium]
MLRRRSNSPEAARRLKSGFRAAAVLLFVLASLPVRAAEDAAEGRFDIRSASVELVGGVYYLDASIALTLSSEAREALRSGVPLTIRLDVALEHRRRFWWDGDDAMLRQRYELEYHALTERYVVSNLNSGDQTSFATLHSALDSLGQIERLPLIDAALLDDDRRHDVRLRIFLDSASFPGPLRLLAFWRRDWSIASDWYRCPLVQK